MERILARLDEHLSRNDYAAAERHLLFWLAEKKDTPVALPLSNELMGLYRKLGRHDEAIATAEKALALVERLGLSETLSAATTYLNTATVLHAAGKTEEGLPYFERARALYEALLPKGDARLGGLYNNMGLALVALSRYEEARVLYRLALSVMEALPDGAGEVAITLLNLADAAREERGAEAAEAETSELMERAWQLLDAYPARDGHYAFVCEKCAPIFGFYGYFRYEKELSERARRIYERA
jgi:tetratricopeptide (TPR) repeat protein